MTSSCFQSFLQAGFECSTHINRDYKRLDLIQSTQHDVHAARDYLALRQLGVKTVREGARWHLIEQSPGCYDFASLRPILRPARELGMEVILDVFHFGWPTYLDIFSGAFVDAFARYSEALADFLIQEEFPVRYLAPMNEISFLTWGAGDEGFVFPFKRGRGNELKRQLVRAALAACRVLRRKLPDAKFVWPEPAIHIVGRPEIAGDEAAAEAYRLAQFEAWDMLAGRRDHDLGGSIEYLDILGVNFYDRNEWVHHTGCLSRDDPRYRSLHQILGENWERYRRPLFISETGTEDEGRPGWFDYIWEEAATAQRLGIPVHGVCLYPILNHPGWDDDRHCRNGLFDYADAAGNRDCYEPLLAAMSARYPARSQSSGA